LNTNTKGENYMESLSPSTRHKHKVCSDPDLIEVQKVVGEVYASGEPPLLNLHFEKLLLEAVDEGLAWLGESASQAIYYHLENDFNIKKQDIPCKIEGFANALEKIFGAAAALLEIEIMKKLHEKFGDSFRYLPEQKDLVFIEYVKTIKFLDLNKLL
jgi:hypothetical protein